MSYYQPYFVFYDNSYNNSSILELKLGEWFFFSIIKQIFSRFIGSRYLFMVIIIIIKYIEWPLESFGRRYDVDTLECIYKLLRLEWPSCITLRTFLDYDPNFLQGLSSLPTENSLFSLFVLFHHSPSLSIHLPFFIFRLEFHDIFFKLQYIRFWIFLFFTIGSIFNLPFWWNRENWMKFLIFSAIYRFLYCWNFSY